MSTETVSHKNTLQADLPVVRFRVSPDDLHRLKTYVARNKTTIQHFCYTLIFSHLDKEEGIA
jgi:hypothetical protein